MDNIGPVILDDEIIATMKDMKDGKTAEVDNIPVDLLKCLQEEGLRENCLVQWPEEFMKTKMGNTAERREESGLEDLWIMFKKTLLKAAEKVCGKQKCDQAKKKARWWNIEVQEAKHHNKDEIGSAAKDSQLWWYGHLNGMDESRYPKRVFEARPDYMEGQPPVRLP
ncbi:hypothetical protein ILUMI_06918 [Ignelater luminosus]|uniref:Uncharacterized protein n=1 Tax=Ignelater luminosus TaxID=2038154 RepID=A0A8K0D4E9_IGNLU|nr:hypothetical protein ILUMI_06918 [Ignelater luminosus]